jgi:hypothetical protein
MSDNSRRLGFKRTVRALYEVFDGRCAFPDCPYSVPLDDGHAVLEVAHITAAVPGGPRFDPDVADKNDLSNFVLVCPQHHREIDMFPEKYPAKMLYLLRRFDESAHLDEDFSEAASTPRDSERLTKFEDALELWREQRMNDSEEYWQRLFTVNPELLLWVTQGRAFTLQGKCYVGGKAVTNRGGGVCDFLVQHATDAIIVEIKTPTANLLGGKYRSDAYPPSRELSGSIIQSLQYKDSLEKESYILRVRSPDLQVFDPRVFVVIGDMERESLSGSKLQSFELFRRAFKDVTILTYDEIFKGIEGLAGFWSAFVVD